MNGAWIVYEDTETWGGGDMIFATEEDARAWLAEANAKDEGKPGAWLIKLRHAVFVPWGDCAGNQ